MSPLESPESCLAAACAGKLDAVALAKLTEFFHRQEIVICRQQDDLDKIRLHVEHLESTIVENRATINCQITQIEELKAEISRFTFRNLARGEGNSTMVAGQKVGLDKKSSATQVADIQTADSSKIRLDTKACASQAADGQVARTLRIELDQITVTGQVAGRLSTKTPRIEFDSKTCATQPADGTSRIESTECTDAANKSNFDFCANVAGSVKKVSNEYYWSTIEKKGRPFTVATEHTSNEIFAADYGTQKPRLSLQPSSSEGAQDDVQFTTTESNLDTKRRTGFGTSHCPPKLERSRFMRNADRWRQRYQELTNYKLQHGHCNVPKSHSDESLHRWVRQQRKHRREFDANVPCDGMCQERIDALDRIGFQWYIGHVSKDKQWDNMFLELINYKSMHGDCYVKASAGKLGKWVLNQRARRRLLEKVGEGKCRGMTWARVAKLDAIDFSWEGRRGVH